MTTPQKLDALRIIGRCKTELVVLQVTLGLTPFNNSQFDYSIQCATNTLVNLENEIKFHQVQDLELGTAPAK